MEESNNNLKIIIYNYVLNIRIFFNFNKNYVIGFKYVILNWLKIINKKYINIYFLVWQDL